MIDELLKRIEMYQERIREVRRYQVEQEDDWEEEDYYEDESEADEYESEYKLVEIPEEVSFDETVEIISGQQYYGEDAMNSKPLRYTVSPDNPWYFDIDGVVFSRETGMLILFPPGKGEEYEIPDDERITGIGDFAFANNIKLKRIVLNDRIQYIGLGAFMKCTALQEIMLPHSIEHIEKSALKDCTALKTAILNFNIRCIPDKLLNNDIELETVRYPADITSINLAAFGGCKRLKNVKPLGIENDNYDVVFPDGICRIGREAFRDCIAIQSVFSPSSVKTLERDAFRGCISLQIICTEHVEEYYGGCFQNCTSLERFAFGDNTKRLGKELFTGDENLKEIHFSCAPGLSCAADAIPEDVEITINTKAYLAAEKPFNCKPLFHQCIRNIAKGEIIPEDMHSMVLQILKRNRKKLYHWFLEDKDILSFVVKADILDCDNCISMIKVTEADNPDMADIISNYMNSQFARRKIIASYEKRETEDREKKEEELRSKRLQEEREKQKQELLSRIPLGMDITLEEMDLSVRAYNCLKRHGINFLSEITVMSDEELMKVRNLGRRSADEVLEKVQFFINGGKVLERNDTLVDFSEDDLSDVDLFDDL